MKVYCAMTECKYNNDKTLCTADIIGLSYHSVMTYHDGRQEFLKCQQYEMSEDAKKLAEQIKKIMDKQPITVFKAEER